MRYFNFNNKNFELKNLFSNVLFDPGAPFIYVPADCWEHVANVLEEGIKTLF